jgi:hypothetical protein
VKGHSAGATCFILDSDRRLELCKTTLTAVAGGRRVAMTESRLTGGTCVNCYPTQAEVFQRIALEYVAKQASGR